MLRIWLVIILWISAGIASAKADVRTTDGESASIGHAPTVLRLAQRSGDALQQLRNDHLRRMNERRRRDAARRAQQRDARQKAFNREMRRRADDAARRSIRLQRDAYERARRLRSRRTAPSTAGRITSSARRRGLKLKLPTCKATALACCKRYFSTSYRGSDRTVLISGQRKACPYIALKAAERRTGRPRTK